MNKRTPIPFGLHFAEHPTPTKYIASIYDEVEGISMVVDENGQKIPLVEYYGIMATKTFTKVQAEDTDEDQEALATVSTKTYTEVKEESSDSDDDHPSLILSTKTETFVQSEQTDDDPGIDTGPKPPLSTGTATKVAWEETDKD